MALCLEVGLNTKAHGICCIAVGDNLIVRGSHQVRVGEKVTLPSGLTKDQATSLIPQLQEMILVYNAMADQGHAPPDFGSKAEQAINVAIESLKKVCTEPKPSEQAPEKEKDPKPSEQEEKKQ
jgi:hypothetical protein